MQRRVRRDPVQPAHGGAPLRAAGGARGARQPHGGGVRPGRDGPAEAFWAEQAERLDWDTKWDQVLDWDNPPFAKWFVGGTLNAAYNCVDRHVEAGHGDKVAIHWVGEPEDDTRDITYAELKDEVCQAANALTELGVADRRPGRDLHADDPRDGRRDAGLRPHRRPAHRGLRRLLLRRARRPARRLRGEGGHHRRRRLPPRRPVGAQAGRRRGASPRPRSTATTSSKVLVVTAHRPGRRVGRRRDVWWHDAVDERLDRARRPSRSTPSTRSTSCTPRARPASPRASCTRPAATSPARRTRTGRSSTSSPRPTSTGAPPTSAGSPATPTWSTARSPTARRR